MSRVKIIEDNKQYLIFCPACNCAHGVDNSWSFNGDIQNPTFQPSILFNGNARFINPTVPRCHSFVIDGKIQFLNDCTHTMVGKTVELPEWE